MLELARVAKRGCAPVLRLPAVRLGGQHLDAAAFVIRPLCHWPRPTVACTADQRGRRHAGRVEGADGPASNGAPPWAVGRRAALGHDFEQCCYSGRRQPRPCSCGIRGVRARAATSALATLATAAGTISRTAAIAGSRGRQEGVEAEVQGAHGRKVNGRRLRPGGASAGAHRLCQLERLLSLLLLRRRRRRGGASTLPAKRQRRTLCSHRRAGRRLILLQLRAHASQGPGAPRIGSVPGNCDVRPATTIQQSLQLAPQHLPICRLAAPGLQPRRWLSLAGRCTRCRRGRRR